MERLAFVAQEARVAHGEQFGSVPVDEALSEPTDDTAMQDVAFWELSEKKQGRLVVLRLLSFQKVH